MKSQRTKRREALSPHAVALVRGPLRGPDTSTAHPQVYVLIPDEWDFGTACGPDLPVTDWCLEITRSNACLPIDGFIDRETSPAQLPTTLRS